MPMSHFTAVTCVAALFIAGTASAQQAPGEAVQGRDQIRWLDGFGVGFRSGAAIRESAVGRDFHGELAIGGEVLAEIFGYKVHRAVLSAGYLHAGNRFQGGTAKVQVITELIGRFDLTIGYEFKWKLLVTGARIGPALTLVSSRIVQKELDFAVQNDQLVFTETGVIDETEASGADWGVVGGVGAGIDLGRFFDYHNLIEIRAQADYLRRGERDEIFVWGMIAFWPLELFS